MRRCFPRCIVNTLYLTFIPLPFMNRGIKTRNKVKIQKNIIIWLQNKGKS